MTLGVCDAAIDWAATGSMTQGVGTVAGVFAVLIAAGIGAQRFSDWEAQKIAERRMSQAERILTATYNARRALEGVRHPMMLGGELHAAEEELKKQPEWASVDKDRQKRLVTTQTIYTRIHQYKPEQDALRECLAMARAIFGEEVEAAIDKLLHQFWIVRVDADAYADDIGDDPAFSARIRRGMYDTKNPESEVTQAIVASVKTIEDTCLPALRSGIVGRKKGWLPGSKARGGQGR